MAFLVESYGQFIPIKNNVSLPNAVRVELAVLHLHLN
jgi:hypothetical protein